MKDSPSSLLPTAGQTPPVDPSNSKKVTTSTTVILVVWVDVVVFPDFPDFPDFALEDEPFPLLEDELPPLLEDELPPLLEDELPLLLEDELSPLVEDEVVVEVAAELVAATSTATEVLLPAEAVLLNSSWPKFATAEAASAAAANPDEPSFAATLMVVPVPQIGRAHV